MKALTRKIYTFLAFMALCFSAFAHGDDHATSRTEASVPDDAAYGAMSRRLIPFVPEKKLPDGMSQTEAQYWQNRMSQFISQQTVPVVKQTRVFLSSLPMSSGQALWRGETNTCELYIDPLSAFRTWGADNSQKQELVFHFVMLHELAHCHFYQDSSLIWKGRSQQEAKQLQTLVELEAWLQVEERVNYFAFAHENYADLFAIGKLLDMGYTVAQIEMLRTIRGEAMRSPSHQTNDGIGMYLQAYENAQQNGKRFTFEEQEAIARTLTAQILLNANYFGMMAALPLEDKQYIIVQAMTDSRQAYWEQFSDVNLIGKHLGWLGTQPQSMDGAPFSKLKSWFFVKPQPVDRKTTLKMAQTYYDTISP